MTVFMFSRSEIKKNLKAIQFKFEQVLKIFKSSILPSVFNVRSLKKRRGQIFWKKANIFHVQMAVFMFRCSEINNLKAIQIRLEQVQKISNCSILRSVFSDQSLKKEGVIFLGKRLKNFKIKGLCSCSGIRS